MSCDRCICRDCMKWWSSRCPYGGCWDDYRAMNDPYPGPERRFWTEWNKPGEQAHWCRGGMFYPVTECQEYVKYQNPAVLTCFGENIQKWPDGYIQCGLIELHGCEWCWERYMKERRDDE